MANKAAGMARFVFGCFLIVAATIVFVGTLTPKVFGPFSSTNGVAPPNQFELRSEVQLPTAGPLLFRIGKLEVLYPAVMRENETLPVEVTYSVVWNPIALPDPLGRVSTDPPPIQRIKQLDREVKLELTSSGFAIEPKSEVAKAKNAPLPTKQVWTVTPTAEGSRYLLLRIEEEKETAVWGARPFSYTASINGTSTQTDANGFYKLPVTVKTFWGFSRVTSSVFGFALLAIGGFLSYPIVVNLLKTWFGLKEDG